MKKNGYTFIELLVVITIMVLLGAGILLQQNLIKEDNVLTGAASDLQSFLRLAQSYATTSVLCEGVGSSAWTIEPRKNAGKDVLDLKCDQPDPKPAIWQKTFNLNPNIEISSIGGNNSGGCNANYPTQNLTIRYPVLSAKPNFDSPVGNSCVLSSTYLDFTLKNTKTTKTIIVTVDKGGTVDVK